MSAILVGLLVLLLVLLGVALPAATFIIALAPVYEFIAWFHREYGTVRTATAVAICGAVLLTVANIVGVLVLRSMP